METPYETTPTPTKEAIASKAAIAKHPIHPMLIPFPIAFLVGTLVADVIYLISHQSFWAQTSFWMNIAGVITGVIAAVIGLVDFFGNVRIRKLLPAWIHLVGNLIVMGLAVVNIFVRVNNPDIVPNLGIALSAAVALLLVVTGWFGGEMVFRHRVGVREE
jgi:uncharacterized membrane protein